jgi:hypothetical protein
MVTRTAAARARLDRRRGARHRRLLRSRRPFTRGGAAGCGQPLWRQRLHRLDYRQPGRRRPRPRRGACRLARRPRRRRRHHPDGRRRRHRAHQPAVGRRPRHPDRLVAPLPRLVTQRSYCPGPKDLDDVWGSGVSAATGSDGKPWVVFTIPTGFELLHFGNSTREFHIKGCCVYNPGIGLPERNRAVCPPGPDRRPESRHCLLDHPTPASKVSQRPGLLRGYGPLDREGGVGLGAVAGEAGDIDFGRRFLLPAGDRAAIVGGANRADLHVTSEGRVRAC